MVVGHEDFERHSKRVNNEFSDEIARRCVMSRVYYSAFHYVRENGRNDPSSNFTSGGGDHGAAQQLLRDKGRRTLAQNLNTLHEERKRADYDLDETIESVDVDRVLRTYRQFMTNVQYIL